MNNMNNMNNNQRYSPRGLMGRLITAGVVSASLSITGNVMGQGAPANDECASPDLIQGVGVFPWSNQEATAAFQLEVFCGADEAQSIQHDVWFCWTSTCDGLVRISLCGASKFDTRMQIFGQCGCPSEKNFICCGDNECLDQAEVYCEVVCDRNYMIRIGSAQLGTFGGGEMTIECVEASCVIDDPPSGPEGCDNCCEQRPSYDAPEYAAFGGGQVAFQTRQSLFTTESVLLAYDLSDEANAPLGVNWNVPRYEPQLWSRNQLGSVFGVALNGLGEVFVAHTSCYGFASGLGGFDQIGALGSPGSIYRIDPLTAQPTNWVTLPNSQDPAITPASESWPGLGNIAWDCANDVLFASNMEDGRIYRIDASGTVLDTYDHATGVISLGGTAEPNDPPGFVPLGERIWAVCPGGSRLYYSLWVEDENRPDAAAANQIWSVEIGLGGAFVGGTAVHEIDMPPLGNFAYSSPVSDLALSDECCLLVAERTMRGDTVTGPHKARVMKFCLDEDGSWAETDGPFFIGSSGTNASGGVDFDNGPDPFIWAPGDILQVNTDQIYGLSGQPIVGAAAADCILIDADTDVFDQEKTEMGSVEVSCWEPFVVDECLAEGSLDCIIDDGQLSGDYALELTITNNSGQDAHFLNIVGPVDDHSIPLAPLADGSSTTINLTVLGPIVDDVICLNLVLLNVDNEACCSMEICLDVPDCDCAVFDVVNVTCLEDGVYSFTFQVTNLFDPHVFESLFFNTDAGSPTSFDPDYVSLGGLVPFATSGVLGPVTVNTTLPPGSMVSVQVGLHNESLKECCVEILEFVLPECDGPSTCPIDLNGDGMIDGADLGLLLGNFGASGLGDIDCDGDIDGADLGLLLAAWGPVSP